MSEQLKPCPFCGGPPVVFVQRHEYPYTEIGLTEVLTRAAKDSEVFAEGIVFCHECGAQASGDDQFLEDEAGYRELERLAIRKWNDRDQRHSDLYDSNLAEGRCVYPRQDGAA